MKSPLQNTKNARECFQRVLQFHASYPGTLPNAWNNLGILDAREGKFDLWAIGAKQAMTEEAMRALAKAHFPQPAVQAAPQA